MDNYTLYKVLLGSIRDTLGLGCFEFLDTPELHPYSMCVLEFLVDRLVSGDPENQYVAIKNLSEILDSGNSALTGPADFREFMGLDQGTDLDSDWFLGIAWTSVTTGLWEAIKCSYAGILWELENKNRCECHCGCPDEITEEDNLYTKLLGYGSNVGGGCGCGKD